jgi:hypothetical protein
MTIYTVGADYATNCCTTPTTVDYKYTTTYSSLKNDLEGHLYQPINEETTSAIKNTLNNNYRKYLLEGWIKPREYTYYTMPADPSATWECTGTGSGVKWDYTINNTLLYNNRIYNGLSNENFWYSNDCYVAADSKAITQARLKSNLVIQVRSRANLIDKNVAENERIALDTLREVVSETEFRKYLKYGFVLVQGKSGDTYQVFRNKSHTKVWRNGELVEEICVRLQDSNVPATDNVIAFKTMIETNEAEFKKCGNVYKMKKAA